MDPDNIEKPRNYLRPDTNSNAIRDSDAQKPRLARAKTIGDFLSVWLENELLESPHQEVLEEYYWSYRRYFGERMRAAYSEQIKEALELVQAQRGARVLEVGFGLGTESLWLAMQGVNVVAIDILANFKEAATRRKAQGNIGTGNWASTSLRISQGSSLGS
jgi:SAM-dependent methyltransferase